MEKRAQLANKVNECNDTHHRIIKAAGIQKSTYIDFVVKNNDKDPGFKVGDLWRGHT